MTDDVLHYLPATEALRRFKARQLSPVELLEALIARAGQVEPLINAFDRTYYDEALAQARQAEARYMGAGDPPRELEGLPLVVKADTDSAIAGQVSSNGALWMKDNVEDHTNPSLERLMAAGAIIQARTTCPELCWTWTCYTRLNGTTRNPWNTAYTPGGSSGGAGASLAAGSAVLATGTDCLGSLRHPSAMCGVVGFKPPYGRNPTSPWVNFDSFNQIGPMTRTVADSALMQNVMSGPHPLDHNSLQPKLVIPDVLADIRGLKIAYSIDLGYFPVTDDVQRETLAALDALRCAGAEVTEVSVEWAQRAMTAAAAYIDHLHGDEFMTAIRDHADEVCDYTAFYLDVCEKITAADFHAALETAGWIWRDHFGPLFQRYDAFVCPTLAFHEVPAENPPWERSIVVRGESYTDHGGVMTGMFNLFNRCPTLVVPSGLTDGGMPTSLQIAGRPYDDVTAYRVAAAVERARPWLDTPERRPKL